MVSMRCKIVIKSELDKLGLHYTNVELGEVEIMEDISKDQLLQLKYSLLQ
jgi:hypothetical protein